MSPADVAPATPTAGRRADDLDPLPLPRSEEPRQERTNLPLYLLIVIVWSVLLLSLLALIVSNDLRNSERSFNARSGALFEFVSDRLRSNETALDGFASLVSVMPDLDRTAAAEFGSLMHERYPHIFMFELIQRVEHAELEAFEQKMRDTLSGNFHVRTFEFSGDRQWKPVSKKAYYFPITFMAPSLPGSHEVLGLDLDSHPLFKRALEKSAESLRPVATHPFRLVEGKTAYVLHRPIRRHGSDTHSGDIFQHEQYALAVIETADIVPAGRDIGEDLSIRLYHGEFTAGDPAGLLHAHQPGLTPAASSLFPTLRFHRDLNSHSQPFRLLIEQRLGWQHLSWNLILVLLAAALITFVAVFAYARAHHRRSLLALQNERRLFFLANHDSLTGLANRDMCHDRLSHAIAQARSQDTELAFIFLDLNNFRSINERFGHNAGNRLLRAAAERLLACLREQDTVARIGGDEFAVILENTGRPEAEAVLEKIHDSFAQPFVVGDRKVAARISGGISMFPSEATSIATLLQHSDNAMYAGKSTQRIKEQMESGLPTDGELTAS